MKTGFEIKVGIERLTDGSEVFYVSLIDHDFIPRKSMKFEMISEKHCGDFALGLQKLILDHTNETPDIT